MKPMRIVLVVENDAAGVDDLRAIAASVGCVPCVAQSIGEALDLLSRFKPDVALLSDTVPGAVADEFLKQLPLPPARIIVMANGAITNVRSQLIGIVLVFGKP
jgi:CheY-like chemotaxis protein